MTEELLLVQNDGKTLYLGPPKEFKADSLPKYLIPYHVTRISYDHFSNEVYIKQGNAELADLKRGGIRGVWHAQLTFNLDTAVIDALKKLADHKPGAEK